MADDANVAAKALLENPQFMEIFQRALESEGGDGSNLKEMPKEGDPKRDAWLRDLQAKLQKESMKEATKTLEEVHSDSQGQWMYVLPTPGFCIKCLVSGGAKVFINVCQHERIAEPVPMESESGAEEEVRFRIPLSCGQARPGEDKGGKPCKVYDVIVNPNTIKRCGDDHEFRRFVAALCMQWIKQKMEPTLNADEFRNLNFKAKGTLEPQRIRLSQLSKNTNAMGDEIKLPQTSAAATAPTQVGGTSGTGKLIEELGGDATTSEAASSPVSAGVDERVLLASDVATKGGSSAAQEPPTQNAPAVIKLSKEGNYDWSTHKKPSMNVFFRESVPAFYDVELFIPNIQTIKEVDVRVSSKKLECFYVDDEADCSAPFLAVVFDYPVSEEIQSAKFVRKTSRLRMQLHVELPDETSAPRTTPSRDAVEEEEEEERLAREKRQAEWAEQRTKEARQQAEEQQVMDERKAYVENLSAVQSGEVPPVIREEIDAMPVAQLPLMLRRIEGRIRKGDSIDTMLDKLPEEVLDGLGDYLREKLSLAPRKRNTTKASKKVSFSADVADKKAPAAASPTAAPAAASTPTPPATAAEKNDGVSIEYNYAKKSQQLFGVEFRNRYLFALDN